MKILSPTEMQLLTIVSTDELSGREVADFLEKETGSRISYGTLYTTFRRLKEQGWVNSRDDEDTDGRVRYFKITGAGATALRNARKHYMAIANFGLGGAAA